MARLYGRAPEGRRVEAAVPHGHWNSSTFIAALRQDGLTAPLLLDGAMDGDCFLAYIEQVLVPTLRPGDRVICDNLSTHKVKGIREAIEAAGASLHYLPAYSPDLNPIEMAFSKLKAHLRQAAARCWDSLTSSLAQTLDTFSPSICQAFFIHAKYTAT
jgi:transposase